MLKRADPTAEPAPGSIDAARVHADDDHVERVASRVANSGGLLSNRAVVKALAPGTDKKRPVAPSAIARLGPGHGLGPVLAERAARASIASDSVRLHTGSSAASFTASIGARAATVGNHIALGRGVRPATHEGRRVIDHELVHVAQRVTKIARNGEDEHAASDDTGVGGLAPEDVAMLEAEIEDLLTEADLDFVLEQIGEDSDESEVAFWDKLAEDPRARALKFRAAMILQEATITTTEQLYEYIDQAETWAVSESDTLDRIGDHWLEGDPWAFPDTWADRVEGSLVPPSGLEAEAAQTASTDAYTAMLTVAQRMPDYLWEHGLPVPFADALSLRAYPFRPTAARETGTHVVHEFAREAEDYLPKEVTSRLATGWAAGKRSLVSDVRAGLKTIDPASWAEVTGPRAFQPDLTRLAEEALDREIDIDSSMGADIVDLWHYELALAKLSGLMELLFRLHAAIGIAAVFAEALGGADLLVANASADERLDHADAWASAQGYPSAARTALVASLKANAGQLAMDVAKDVAISMIPFIGWGWRIKEAIEEAADWYQAGESLVDARDRASAATSVVALQRAAAQISSAEIGIAAQVALTAASKGAEVAVGSAVQAVKGSAGEAVEADLAGAHADVGTDAAASAPGLDSPSPSATTSPPVTGVQPGPAPELAAEVAQAIDAVEKGIAEGEAAVDFAEQVGKPRGVDEAAATQDTGVEVRPPVPEPPGKSRVPRTDGGWDGDPGDSDWVSFKVEVNRITKSEPVPYRNGEPVLTKWAVAQVLLTSMTGGKADFSAARASLMKRYPGRWKSLSHVEKWEKGLANDEFGEGLGEAHTWHHEPDVETMTLVSTALHANVPHLGGASKARGGEVPARDTAPLDTSPL